MRILITGGAGFVGSHLCDRLLADGHHVVVVDNFCTGRRENIEHLFANNRFTLDEQDVCEPFDIEGDLDEVYHLASPASPVDYLSLPVESLMTGSLGTKHALDAARRHDAAFLLASTSECYGDPLEHPQKETYWGNVNPVGPRAVYDEAKRFAEALTMAYHRKYGMNSHIVRIFNTYGPRMKLNDGRVVPAFLDQALHGKPITIFGDGSQTRSFCYVSDLVEGLVRLMRSDERYPVNLGNPTELAILEFAERIQELVGSHCEIEFCDLPQDDPRQRRPDISKAKRLLDWEPHVPLDEGLRLTVEYFQNREGATRRQAS